MLKAQFLPENSKEGVEYIFGLTCEETLNRVKTVKRTKSGKRTIMVLNREKRA